MKRFIRFVLGLLAPFILVFGGAGLVGLGLEHDLRFLVWAGAIATACGLLWGCWLLLLDGESLWGD